LLKVFSVERGDPLTLLGPRPADLLTLSGAVLEPCEELGLLCDGLAAVGGDDLSSLSYGWDFGSGERLTIEFSVGRGSTGAAGSAVRREKNCAIPEPHADVFFSQLDALNTQELDGDGTACTTNAGLGLFIHEAASSDNLDALASDACLNSDLNCDSRLEDLVYFTLAPGSPSLTYLGATAGDILVAGIDSAPLIYAHGVSDLGLKSGDAIDALCLYENGDGFFDPRDVLLFSLAPGSPSLGGTVPNAASLVRPGPRPGITPWALGLESTDDLDAANCHGPLAITDLFLPLARKR